MKDLKISPLTTSFLRAVEQSPASIVITDTVGAIQYVNPRFTAVTGYAPGEVIGQNPRVLQSGEQTPEFYRELWETITAGGEWRGEFHNRKKDGTLYWESASISPIRNEAGGITHYLAVKEDITEKKEMEQRLQQFRRAVEQSPATVVITDTKGDIEYVNPKFSALTGYTAEEAMGKNPRVLKSGEQPPEFYRELWDTITAGGEWRGEFHNRKKNGELYWESASISPIRDAAGKVTHFLAVKEDITARRNFEDALQRRNEMMERDLRNAQIVQKALLPKEPPFHERLKTGYRYVPVDMVGGDYFSFTLFPKGDLGVFIGDVSGHGVSSALFLSLIKATTDRVCRKHGQSPRDYISSLNVELADAMSSYFITAVYGLFRFGAGGVPITFTFSKGAHPLPALQRASTGEISLLDSKGSLIGQIRDMEFDEVTVEMHRGDRIYLYTDGIPELKNERGVILGFDEFPDLIRRTSKPDLDETLDAIMEEVHAFRGKVPVEDDMLLIGFELT